jgi:hypothetical protein
MRRFRRDIPSVKSRRRKERRPFMIDVEDFDFVDEIELLDWMLGSGGLK